MPCVSFSLLVKDKKKSSCTWIASLMPDVAQGCVKPFSPQYDILLTYHPSIHPFHSFYKVYKPLQLKLFVSGLFKCINSDGKRPASKRCIILGGGKGNLNNKNPRIYGLKLWKWMNRFVLKFKIIKVEHANLLQCLCPLKAASSLLELPNMSPRFFASSSSSA